MKITLPSVADFIEEAPFAEVRLGVFSRMTSAKAGESAIPFVVYEVFLTGAKEDKLFEYRLWVGQEFAHFEEGVKKLDTRAFEAKGHIQRQLQEVGIAVKEGRIESL